ncbi:hypothetical protein GIY62_20580 [Burkholderia plantarii]|uniref:hypothetical protein n=1 Tax=Burkholderia plantarii TaxID=41899 RepID=UPI002729D24C|nr:hypothetical protein [Burkholderia plantarii]WLE62789.1 hypothetical protein GIY62_20580 [Burkholderia plantarii]
MDSSAPACHDRWILARFRHREHDFHGMARVFRQFRFESARFARTGAACGTNRRGIRERGETLHRRAPCRFRIAGSAATSDPRSAGRAAACNSCPHGIAGLARAPPAVSPGLPIHGGAAESSLPRTRPLTHRSDAAVGPLYRILDIAPADRDHGVRDMLDA